VKLRHLFEAENKTAVVAFGRMNPPTIGHAKLVDRIKSIQGDHYVFLMTIMVRTTHLIVLKL